MNRSLIHQALTDTAARQPQRTAVEAGAERLTYWQLDARSSRLAGVLQAKGVTAGDRVALHLDKSIGTVIGIFAILKTGAAYVPVDTRSPPARTGVILADCGVRVILGDRAKAARIRKHLPAETGPVLVTVDPESGETQDAPDLSDAPAISGDRAPRPPTANDPAYILYTSGSTGTPKGVAISHRAALSFIEWATGTFALSPDDRVISQAPFHFDLSVLDLFVTLRAGATLVLPPPGIGISPAAYAGFLSEARISLFYATPALLNSLLQHGRLDRHGWQSLRLVLFAGDVMPPGLLRALMAMIPAARYYNLYGPTETNVCTWFEVHEPPADNAPIPIGRACAGLELRIAAADGRLVPGGEAGELWVRGANLMSGYWNHPNNRHSA